VPQQRLPWGSNSQMTADLQAERDTTPPGGSSHLLSKGISFGLLTHNADGTWDVSRVVGLAAPSLSTSGTTPPSLIIRPLHQAGNVISLRQFSNNAFNKHHGMQSEERFGLNTDPDGDGFTSAKQMLDIPVSVAVSPLTVATVMRPTTYMALTVNCPLLSRLPAGAAAEAAPMRCEGPTCLLPA
jgi:hypothetical protein